MASPAPNPQLPKDRKPDEKLSSNSPPSTTTPPDIEDLLLDFYESWVQNPKNRLFPKEIFDRDVFDWDFEESCGVERQESGEDGEWQQKKKKRQNDNGKIDELVMKIKEMEIRPQLEKGKREELQRMVAKLEELKLRSTKGGD